MSVPGGHKVRVSAGIAELRHGETAAGLFERADSALYRAKDLGKDQRESGRGLTGVRLRPDTHPIRRPRGLGAQRDEPQPPRRAAAPGIGSSVTPTRAPARPRARAAPPGPSPSNVRHGDRRRRARRDEPGRVGRCRRAPGRGRRARARRGRRRRRRARSAPPSRAAGSARRSASVRTASDAFDRRTRAGLVVRADLARDRPGAEHERGEPRHDRERGERRPAGRRSSARGGSASTPAAGRRRGPGRRLERGELRLDASGRRPSVTRCRGASPRRRR